MSERLSRFRLATVSIRARLGIIQGLLVVSLMAVSAIAWHASEGERSAGHQLAVLSRAERNLLEATLLQESLRADLEQALQPATQRDVSDVLANAKEHLRDSNAHLAALSDPELPPQVSAKVTPWASASTLQGDQTLALIQRALRNPAGISTSELDPRQSELATQMASAMATYVKSQVQLAERRSFADASRSELGIAIVCLLTAMLAWACVALIAKSVRQSLTQICEAAKGLAAGNLSARSRIESDDELGELALSLNKMADDLQGMVDRLLAEVKRDAFGARVTRALEMAESETDVDDIAARALGQISETLPAELLIVRPGKDALERDCINPHAGAPGCPVETLGACTAVRRGSPTTFETSEALDACPRLRARPSGPISATCVPVAFMGKTFGVIHATSTVGKPPSNAQQTQLATLGAQVGARIGALRTLESTRQHAYTDPLTGLSNRRAMEQHSRETIESGTPYALAMADLDHFKRLNDVQGHEAGDRALRAFSEVVRKSVRQLDRACRWGGEEFAILFPSASAPQVFEVVERIRTNLADALLRTGQPQFTVSFGLADSTMGSSFEDVLRVADQALYDSKDAGRNRTTVASLPHLGEPGDPAKVVALLEN